VISSVLLAKGVFGGIGRIVELPDLPTDPPNFSRDDLVFSEGTMHLVSATVAITSFSVNRATALKRMTQQAHAHRERLERFELVSWKGISWKDNQPFRDARHSCERSMGDLVIGAPAIPSPTQNRSLRDRFRRSWTPPDPRS
jgi:hypothetical protein